MLSELEAGHVSVVQGLEGGEMVVAVFGNDTGEFLREGRRDGERNRGRIEKKKKKKRGRGWERERRREGERKETGMDQERG